MPSLYRKTCPKCSRVFTHPPAFSIHGKSCGVNSAAPEQGQSATCKPISAAVAPTRPSIGPPPKGEGETALRTAPVPLYFKQLESELLTSEIKFKDAKEQEAYVKDMAQQQARNNLTSDNIVVDFGWEPKNDHVKSTPEPATLNAAHGKSEDSTEESSSDFERSDEEYSVGAAAQPAPVSHGKPKLKGAKTLALKRGDGTVDGKYAALIDKVGTAPDHARLAAMSLDDLRFLLRKNGTSSHNMLKMPVVTALARIASTTGLLSEVALTSEPTGRKRQRSAASFATAGEKRRKDGDVITPDAAAVAPSRSSKRERKLNQLGSDYVDPSTIDQGYFHASIGGESDSNSSSFLGDEVVASKKQAPAKKKTATQRLVAQSKLDEVMSKYTYLDSPGFASPFQQQSKVRIQAASDSEEEEELFLHDEFGSDGGKDREVVLAEMLRKPIYIPPTSGEDLFAAYLKIS